MRKIKRKEKSAKVFFNSKNTLITSILFIILFLICWLWPIETVESSGELMTRTLKDYMQGTSLWTTNGLIIATINNSDYSVVFLFARIFSILATVIASYWIILTLIEYNNHLRTKNVEENMNIFFWE